MKTITEYIAIDNNGVKVITEQEAKENKTSNIYFLDGVRGDIDYSNGQRAKDEDIVEKDFFVIDVDLRNNCDYEITNEDIIKELTNFAQNLEKEHELFGEWSKIVFTGNGGHIYYYGTPQHFEKEEYSIGVETIYKEWDNWWGANEYKSDHACKNLARILRLPGSINQKNGTKVEIIAERKTTSKLFNDIKKIAKEEKERIKKLEEKKQKELEDILKNFTGDENKFYETINSIPAFQIVQILLPQFPLHRNGKNFDNKKGAFTGYWYDKTRNIIFNGGSRYFTEQTGFNNFQLVKHFKNWDNRQTFEFFKKLLGLE